MKTTITITHKINNKNSSKTMRVYELRATKLSANNHKKQRNNNNDTAVLVPWQSRITTFITRVIMNPTRARKNGV